MEGQCDNMVAIVRRIMSALAAGKRLDPLLDEGKTRGPNAWREGQLAVVGDVARVIGSTLDIQYVYEEFAQALRQIVDFDRVAVALVDQDAGTIAYKYSFGEAAPGVDVGNTVPLEGTRMQVVLMTGRTLVTEDMSSQSEYESDRGFSTMGLLVLWSTWVWCLALWPSEAKRRPPLVHGNKP